MIELEVTEYRYPRQRPPGTHPTDEIRIARMSVGVDRWAIRCAGERLIRHGKGTRWVYEPSPSDRTEKWIERATFTLAEMAEVIEAQIGRDAHVGRGRGTDEEEAS